MFLRLGVLRQSWSHRHTPTNISNLPGKVQLSSSNSCVTLKTDRLEGGNLKTGQGELRLEARECDGILPK